MKLYIIKLHKGDRESIRFGILHQITLYVNRYNISASLKRIMNLKLLNI